jgi:RNA polymerase sigma-70 factor (ECF subfamily)
MEIIGQWYEQYAKEITHFIRSRGFSSEDADDLCAQVFLEAIQRQPQDTAPRAWLYAVARSRTIDKYRQNTRRNDAPLETWTAAVEMPEIKEIPRAALLLLTPPQQRVIEARFLRDRDLEEVANELGVSVGAIKALQHRGVETLRQQFQGFTIPRHNLTHDRNWAPSEIERLQLGVSQGWNDQAIGQWLGRTPTAIHVKLTKLGISRRAPTTGVASDVARALGAKCAKTVQRWAKLGWLSVHRSSDAQGAVWRFLWADVWAFLEKPEYWMAWYPERIIDPARRTWAIEMRKGKPQWLMPGQVARRYHVTRNVVNTWITRFGLPATRYGNWWVNEANLEGWVPPGERLRDWGPGRPRVQS